jgi:hypothetical protein
MRDRFSESIEDSESAFKILRLAPRHDRKRGLDGSFFAAADRSINHGDADSESSRAIF